MQNLGNVILWKSKPGTLATIWKMVVHTDDQRKAEQAGKTRLGR